MVITGNYRSPGIGFWGRGVKGMTVNAGNSINGERSLYECFHARVKGGRIYCAKGHRFYGLGGRNGTLKVERLARGEPLVMSACQGCADFESMGEPVPAEERGWTGNGESRPSNKEVAVCQKNWAR